MKKFLFLLTVCIVQFSACKKNIEKEEGCNSVSFNIIKENVNARIELYGSDYTSFEVEYGTAGFKLGNGTKQTVLITNPVIENLTYGTYDIYLRVPCSGTSNYSDWSNPIQFVIDGTTSNCSEPRYLAATINSNGPYWNWSGDNDYYDIQYGPTGFKLGEGELIRTNQRYTSEAVLSANTTYDFYVRGNCGSDKFSKWVGPKSFFAPQSYNPGGAQCLMPTNLYAYRVNSMEINFQFTASGALNYEYSFTASSSSPGSINSTTNTSGTVAISTGSASVSYFWVRSKCTNGSFTNWAKVQIQ
ncbi:MAG TPA: hypothetical protein PLM55_07885 [Chitinophagales bacterium]|nr:hypothetical protein [Chitinophagales bacterium]